MTNLPTREDWRLWHLDNRHRDLVSFKTMAAAEPLRPVSEHLLLAGTARVIK